MRVGKMCHAGEHDISQESDEDYRSVAQCPAEGLFKEWSDRRLPLARPGALEAGSHLHRDARGVGQYTVAAVFAELLIGVISDTHGLLRPEALEALAGAKLLIHAGDIGSTDILPALARLAPVEAVRGNVDTEAWARSIPETAVVEVQGRTLYVLHDLKQLDLDPRAAGFDAVISGHSHVPANEMRNGVLYFNPGSAGPRRFRLPVTVGRLWVSSTGIKAEIVVLNVN
jgi:uncharacterized protein